MRGWQIARRCWMLAIAALAAAVMLVAIGAAQTANGAAESPWDLIPERGETPDHSAMLTEPFADAKAVTATCLICHADVAEAVLQTSHWTWISGAQPGPNGEELPYGKLNALNNFCISVAPNWGRCSQCHISYGWDSADFDFSNPETIDCLVCHDTTGTYRKSPTAAGFPADDVDLLAVAQSVGRPDRTACGSCHFYGGGDDAVKHGDMSSTLAEPAEDIDVHMGRFGLLCQDCHRTQDHQISGRLPMLSNDVTADVRCESCHGEAPHSIFRINAHCHSVACQACHVPAFAPIVPTRLEWDWSTAGLPAAPDDREWERKKGSFVSGTDVIPAYLWWNGEMRAYLPGQQLDPSVPTILNAPQGSFEDGAAKIWPFKLHSARQPYDAQGNYLLAPKLFGEDGFWRTWDWDSACRLGAAATGTAYSGEFAFADTVMYWPITHMVRPKEQSLGCMECHGEAGRINWAELGYESDPMVSGSRPHHRNGR